MTPRHYCYSEPLDAASLRLLRIKETIPHVNADLASSVKHSSLALDIITTSLANAPEYRALSYTWGPPEDDAATYSRSEDHTVSLDGCHHHVNPNLHDALLQIAQSYRGSYFWIDAICINQGDLDERLRQVAMMDKIYNNAVEVILWLGREARHSSEVFQVAKTVAGMDSAIFLTQGHAISPDQLESYGLPGPSSEIWRHYINFYERRWFKRGWVIQEVILARNAVVHWGSMKMTWDELVAGSLMFLPDHLRKTFFANFRKPGDVDNMSLGRNVYRIQLIRDALAQKSPSLLIVEICTGTHALESAEHMLLHMMRMSRDFQWSDARDKVYSLLGLVSFIIRDRPIAPLPIKPDYSESVTPAMVFTRVARAIIERSNCLGIITQVSDLSFRKISNLPSWVPDFTKSPNLSMGRRNLFSASGTESPLYRFEDDLLVTRGTRLGTMQEVQSLTVTNDFETVVGMLSIASKSTFPHAVDGTEVLWRTLIWDIYGHGHVCDLHPAPDYMGNSFQSWVQGVFTGRDTSLPSDLPTPFKETAYSESGNKSEAGKPEMIVSEVTLLSDGNTPEENTDQGNSPDPLLYTSHASGVTWSQQLFLLDSGYLGMGPMSGEVGDEVWLFPSCSFPMVIRRCKQHQGSYRVLGRAYVHGVMHGEVVGAETVWEEVSLE